MLIIPAIDIRGGKCVRLFQGDYRKETVYGEDPAEQALRWEKEGAHIIHLVDLDGAKEGHPVNLEAVRKICSSVRIPCELGGGIRTIEDARKAFDAGVYRIILGTVACENPKLAKEFVSAFSAEHVVVGVDARAGNVAVNGWKEMSSESAESLFDRFSPAGLKTAVITEISRDGMLDGPDVDLYSRLAGKYPGLQIVASGGVGSMDDVERLDMAGIPAVIVGKAIYEGRISLDDIRNVSGSTL